MATDTRDAANSNTKMRNSRFHRMFSASWRFMLVSQAWGSKGPCPLITIDQPWRLEELFTPQRFAPPAGRWPALSLSRVAGDLANALVQRLELAVHAQVDLAVQPLVHLLRLGLGLEHCANPGHGADGRGEVRV